MLDVQVSLVLPFSYENAFVKLPAQQQLLQFSLKPGTHTAYSEFVELGEVRLLEQRRLQGRWSFGYTYEPQRRVVTVCGSNFESASAMCLITQPEGTMQVCRQYAVDSGFAGDDLLANPNWNYHAHLTPGLHELFADLVQQANDNLIAALQATPGLVVQVRKHPPPLTAQARKDFLLVYRDGEFLGLHDPAQSYGALDRIYSIESVFGGEVTLSYGEAFANVIGSTNDPKIAGLTWIQLWANQFGTYPVICTSYHSGGFGCGSSLVGGHVIGGTQALPVPQGSNSVWILPICIQHNNDDSVSMQALKYLKGIWLKNYLGS